MPNSFKVSEIKGIAIEKVTHREKIFAAGYNQGLDAQADRIIEVDVEGLAKELFEWDEKYSRQTKFTWATYPADGKKGYISMATDIAAALPTVLRGKS